VSYLSQPFHDNPIQLLHYELASPNDTYTLSGPIYHGSCIGTHMYTSRTNSSQFTGIGTEYIDPFTFNTLVSSDSKTYADAYAAQLSRVALSLAAGMIAPTDTLVDYTSSTALGSQFRLVPVVTFVVVNILFIACLFIIGFGANTSGPILKDWKGRNVSAVSLAQMRLTSAGAMIYEMFCASPEKGAKRSGCDEVDQLFEGDGDNQDRIRVGVVEEWNDNKTEGAKSHFGISTDVMRGLDSIGGTVVL
jgi:hypothetical protein